MTPWSPWRDRLLTTLLLGLSTRLQAAELVTKSGILPWVDPATPADRQTYMSSRGDRWELVMSDEFNTPNRSFRPGDDHMWTSVEKPDGVNAALEIYSHNMTTTVCESPDLCYFQIKVIEDPTTLHLWNDYQSPPGYKTVTFYYRAAMVQSWNKFCFQGGMIEVRAQLPGAVSKASGNPDLAKGPNAHAVSKEYYPTWPGIWMMGNLGRAIFSASTNRMWPFSYNECNEKVFKSSNQRISACDGNPGHGLNPYQGRGAPEIDLLEGGGSEISSSIQVGPGMGANFRLMPPDKAHGDSMYCMYGFECKTPGANSPDVPTALYAKRGHKSWYQGLRYSSNNFCDPNASLRQVYATVMASLTSPAGVTENSCGLTNCPGSKDANADLGLIDGVGPDHWGINTNGTCFPTMNGYAGSVLCSPGNTDPICSSDGLPMSDKVTPFAYQMDAISSNWGVHLSGYTDYLVYQLEWVTGSNGYVRWMLSGNPIFEIPATAIENVPQDAAQNNPKKVMLEEPMSIILNVALSSSWGAHPPNAGKACRGNGLDAKTNKICDSFPMYLKIDYIRLYQDVSSGSNMTVGCDPATHPTRQWIEDHIDEYQDSDNLIVEVHGKAFCETNDDCTIGNATFGKIATGTCVNNRCQCNGNSWSGPRCTVTYGSLAATDSDSALKNMFQGSYGPPWSAAIGLAGVTITVTLVAAVFSVRWAKQSEAEFKRNANFQPKSALSFASASDVNYYPPKPPGTTNSSRGVGGGGGGGGIPPQMAAPYFVQNGGSALQQHPEVGSRRHNYATNFV